MSTGTSLIKSYGPWTSQTISDPVVKIYYQFAKKIYITDTNGYNYTSYFWVKNLLSIPIVLNSLQITTGETPSEPIVDTQLLVPGSSNWADSIEFDNLGTINPDSYSRRYQFTMKIVRAIEGSALPDDYINSVFFYPKYTVDYKNSPQFKYDIQVVKS